jgi:tRNA1(Val) A37 N6-methylase TrmN6
MALFQEAIIRKHLLTLDAHLLDSAYNEYKRVYSPEKIKNIRVAKEEQYQEGFIKEIFGSVLGYSVYPESPFNIETEKKNETNARKADGAILSGEKVVGVIELKDNKTKNLDAVKDQAFGYKNNHKDCSYVISSNFHKLRFYIDDATDYEEFDLYNLDKETFKRFYLYLRKEGLLDKNLPKLLRQETKFHEEEISKKLYKDYSNFKRRFFENAVKNNPQHDKLELFKKSQKFLDRILFLLFAEDKGLVGTNSIVSIVEKWSGADDDYYQPLYEMVNKYFGHLYRGYTYQKTGEVIPQFGGELFAPDELLESLKIDDEVLKNDLLILSKYDFNTDVDVNILGHIFEHSLNEVDDVEAELRGETLDKSKSKRKKDGVFYTPKYITKYIVDNTLGKLCNEKKIELKLDEDIAIFEYQKADGKLNEKGKELFERLNTYKSWLLTLKVCDPACGSGAFLNQALSYFIEEHKFVDDIIAELTNTPLRLFDTDLQILENNIFGVDINEESVEIAKLSMWLRTAQPGRKLSDLSNNIKCGNSLIDDPAVAGDKAFNWEREFPAVFEKSGFDVVIGNPPYVQHRHLNQFSSFFKESYKVYTGTSDLSVYFFEKGLNLLKPKGELGFINTNKFFNSEYGIPLRNHLSHFEINQIINFEQVSIFEGALVSSVLITISNKQQTSTKLNLVEFQKEKMSAEKFDSELQNNRKQINRSQLENSAWLFGKIEFLSLITKIQSNGIQFGELSDLKINRGITTGYDEAFLISEDAYEEFIRKDLNNKKILKHILRGKDIKRYLMD